MALLWSMVLLAFFWTLNVHQAFGLRQAMMEEAACGMAGIPLRDSAEWAADEPGGAGAASARWNS